MPTTWFAFESVTVSSTSIGLTVATFEPAGAPPAQFAMITIEGASIRWRYEGGAADATSHLAYVADVLPLEGLPELRNFRAIRSGSVNATLRVSYGR